MATPLILERKLLLRSHLQAALLVCLACLLSRRLDFVLAAACGALFVHIELRWLMRFVQRLSRSATQEGSSAALGVTWLVFFIRLLALIFVPWVLCVVLQLSILGFLAGVFTLPFALCLYGLQHALRARWAIS